MKRLLSFFTAAALVLGHGAFLPQMTDTANAADFKPVKITADTFPDPNFRAAVEQQLDLDGNGELDEQDILYARNIHCDGMGIKSLRGIEYLTELRGLYCTDNEIEHMDLSKNTLLTGIWCSDNPLTELDLTPLKDLLWVYCFKCKLTSLDLTKNPLMAYVECNDNKLGTLNVSKNPELEHLICNSCGLKELDLSNNKKLTHLDALRNGLKKLNISECTKMKRLDIWDNPELGSVDISVFPDLQYYNCANNGLKTLDVSHNPQLNKLNCAYNELKTLDISKNPKLAVLICEDNQLKSLDVSNNPRLHFLQAFINDFTKLSIGDNRFLVHVYEKGETDDVMGIATQWEIDYIGDDSTGGDSKYFLCVDNDVTLNTTATKPQSGTSVYREDDDTDPQYLMTREYVIKALYEMAGKPDVSGLKTRFTDVVKGADYEAAVLWGEKNRICLGFPDIYSDTFGVGKWITRQDLVYMLMAYASAVSYRREIDFGRSDDFLDYNEIDDYAWEAITWAATWNITISKGEPGAPKEECRVDPHGKATREEFAVMLRDLLEANNDTAAIPVSTIPGDVNDDGIVDLADVVVFKQWLAGWNVTINTANANVSGDKVTNVADVVILKQFLAGWKVTLK